MIMHIRRIGAGTRTRTGEEHEEGENESRKCCGSTISTTNGGKVAMRKANIRGERSRAFMKKESHQLIINISLQR